MNTNKYRILFVEDESNIRNFVKTVLETNGYQVLTANTCRQGVMMFSSHTPDLVILDPPRKGCDSTLLETICNLMPPRIVYVSCDPATLARDLKFLCEKGYSFSKVQPVDMFPMSGHVESVVLLNRS